MALFTDGPISSARDLQEYDTPVLSIANSEGIDLKAKVHLAQQFTVDVLYGTAVLRNSFGVQVNS